MDLLTCFCLSTLHGVYSQLCDGKYAVVKFTQLRITGHPLQNIKERFFLILLRLSPLQVNDMLSYKDLYTGFVKHIAYVYIYSIWHAAYS